MISVHGLSLLFSALVAFRPVSEVEPLNVYSFNAGLTKVAGVSLVPEVDARIPLQIAVWERTVKRPFILLLQEVNTRPGWRAYKDWANRKGFWIERHKRRKNGLVIVSSEPLSRAEFLTFSKDEMGTKRGVLETYGNYGGLDILLATTHTAFSNSGGINHVHQDHLSEAARFIESHRNEPIIFGGDFNVGENHILESRFPWLVDELWRKRILKPLKSVVNFGEDSPDRITLDTRNPLHNHPWPVNLVVQRLFPKWVWDLPDAHIDHIAVSERHFRYESSEVLFTEMMYSSLLRRKIPLSDHYCLHSIVRLLRPH